MMHRQFRGAVQHYKVRIEKFVGTLDEIAEWMDGFESVFLAVQYRPHVPTLQQEHRKSPWGQYTAILTMRNE